MQGSMHHEVLLALSGYPGNIFRVSRGDGTIEVDSTLPFVHPSEASQLNRLCQLGTHYNHLRKFISEQNSSTFSLPRAVGTTTSEVKPRTGLYLKALATGVDRVLHGYRQELVRLEEKCVREPHLPLSHLQAHLEQFHLLLPAVEACVTHLTSPSSGCHGCQILSYLYDLCNSGVPSIQEAFQQILRVCHGVLYKQLSSWMLHGLLLEDRDEFFIIQQEKKKAEENRQEEEEEEEEEEEGEEEEAGSRVSAEEGTELEYVIHHAMAPSYLPMRVLEKILFVGEAVTIFKNTQQRKSTSRKQGGALSTTVSDSRLRGDQLRFGDMLAQLQGQPKFRLQDLEKVVDAIRDCVAELLWKLLVEESNLTGQLQVMKDFFLLARGELFLAFIDLAHHFMAAPPTATTQHDVNLAFHQAMTRVGLDVERMGKQFELTVPYCKPRDKERTREKTREKTKDRKESSSTPTASAWDQLSLIHTVQWPLHTLFTPPILNKYNTLFQVLLRLRRTQVSLHQCWALLMQHHRREASLWQVWELRTHMSFLMDNLQYYVQVDVLETQFAHLLHQVRATHDFESIQHAHETFLTTLQSQLFLTQPAVYHCLQELLNLCQALSRLLDSSRDLRLTAREQTEVARIAKDFSRQSSLFFDIISRVKVHGSAPHLAQLLLRIDYNKYYTTIRQNKHGLITPT